MPWLKPVGTSVAEMGRGGVAEIRPPVPDCMEDPQGSDHVRRWLLSGLPAFVMPLTEWAS